MIALLLNLGVMNGLKKPEFMSEIQARVKILRLIFVYSVMIKNQQFHRRIQNEKINELLCNTLCSLFLSVCYLLSPCLSFTSRISVTLTLPFKRSGGRNGLELTLNVIIERH